MGKHLRWSGERPPAGHRWPGRPGSSPGSRCGHGQRSLRCQLQADL